MPRGVDIDKLYGGKAPWFVRACFFSWIILFLAYAAWMAYLPEWASTTADSMQFVEIRLRGQPTYYLSPGLGWIANNGFWILFGAFLAFFVFVHIHAPRVRKRIQREPDEGIGP